MITDRPPAKALVIVIPCDKTFRGEAVSVLRRLRSESRAGTPRAAMIEQLCAAVAAAPRVELDAEAIEVPR